MEQDALAQVHAQRAALAERARLPWWFWVLFALATLGLVGGPVISQLLPGDVTTYAVQWPAIAVYALAERLVRWSQGISLSTRMFEYPSSRIAGIVFLVVAVIGIIGVLGLQRSGLLVAAVVVVLVVSAVMVGAMVVIQRGMREDIRGGRWAGTPEVPSGLGPEAAAAARADLPVWFWVLFTVAVLVTLGGELSGPTANIGLPFVAFWPGLLLLCLVEALVRRAQGTPRSSRLARDFPSARRPLLTLGIVLALGIVGTGVLAQHHQMPIAILVAFVATVFAVRSRVAVRHAVRADAAAAAVNGRAA
jgi:hypothetical protein